MSSIVHDSRPAPPTILFSFAHPDDESFADAGTAMKYSAQGVRTVFVTATQGDGGKRGDPPICEPHEIGECRERELREAAAIIGSTKCISCDVQTAIWPTRRWKRSGLLSSRSSAARGRRS